MSTTIKVSKILSLTLLFGITVISNSGISSLLKDNFNDANKIISIDSLVSGTDYIDGEVFIEDDTTYIDTNTLPLLGNNCEREVKASIAGNNNLSLQNWTADSTIPTSITFSGNNVDFTGTLLLPKEIDKVIFDR